MQKFVVLLVVLALALCAGAAWSYPTMQGATGIVVLPTADVAANGTINLAVDYSKINNNRVLGISDTIYDEFTGEFIEVDLGDTTVWPVRANVGFGGMAEFWAGNNFLSGDLFDGNEWNVGLKYAFMTEAKNGFDLAVGGSYGQTDLDDFSDNLKTWTAFLAASKVLMPCTKTQPSIRGTVGGMYMNFSDGVSDNLFEPYLALEIGYDQFQLASEYRFKDSDIDIKAPWSTVLRYQFKEMPLWLQVGWSNAILLNGIGTDQQEFFAGIGYSFGMPGCK